MSSDNHVQIIGNATRDPELRFTPSGAQLATFGVAVNRRWMNRQTNEWEEEVSFFDVVCWRDLAENVTETVVKGTRVVVVGRLEQRSWENDEGEKRSKVEIVADDVAPSLRWATARVTRNERKEGDGGSSQRAEPAYADDEEPFRVDAGTWDPTVGYGELPERML